MVTARSGLKIGGSLVAGAMLAGIFFLASPGDTHTAEGSNKGVLLASSVTLPGDPSDWENIAVLVSSRRAMRRTWRQFDIEGSPMRVDFERRKVLFVGTGESGTCPEEYQSLERVAGRHLLHVHLDTNWGPVCTDDFRPRTFVVAARRSNFPPGKFDVKIGSEPKIQVRRRG
jgi:hypothetical protein